MKIKNVYAYEIIASGGYPTIECIVELNNGAVGVASVPYGASSGSHEASILLDGDNTRFDGKGMLKAIDNILNAISPELKGKDANDQMLIDKIMVELDGTSNKSKLGGNAILAVSLAVARAAAAAKEMEVYEHIADVFETGADFNELPSPLAVSIEGGKHAVNSTDFQEFCFAATGSQTKFEQVRAVLEAYHKLQDILKKKGLSTNVGNEGAFAPEGIKSNEEPFKYMMEAIEQAGLTPGRELSFYIDAAGSEFYEDGKYNLKLENRKLSAQGLMDYVAGWFGKYPLAIVEDILDEDAWADWTKFNQICKDKDVMHVGDDFTVTNYDRLKRAIQEDSITAILIKLNQIGTLSETVSTCMLASQNGLATIPSHRGGGETNDSFMVDLAVAVGAKFIKVGPTRGERIAKYNRLLEIERNL